MSKGFVIAIDGPVASGKGTIAAKLAHELHGFYLYTGAMYRSTALLCIEKELNLNNENEVESVLPDLNVDFENNNIFLNGRDVTNRLKEPDCAQGASLVGIFPNVRSRVVKKLQEVSQKAIDEGKIVITEGRDTGTVIFPTAKLKI